MKLKLADIPRLQISLLAALIMAALGAACVSFALGENKAAKEARAMAQAERSDFDGKLKRVRSEELEIKQKSAYFNGLEQRGIIGEEARLDWAELLRDIREARRLPELQYEISPQRPLGPNTNGGLGFFASTMTLNARLLHEEDLTRLLDDLRAQAKALIQTRRCSVARLPRGGPEPQDIAQLQAECTIDWITLHVPAGK